MGFSCTRTHHCILFLSGKIKKLCIRTGEIAQQVQALAATVEGSSPSNHVATHNCL